MGIYRGKIKTWNDEKGYGFIVSEASTKDIFAHISSFVNRSNTPTIGEAVTFTMDKNSDGKISAKNIHRVSDTQKNSSTSRNPTTSQSRPRQKPPLKLNYKSTHSIGLLSTVTILSFISYLVYLFLHNKIPIQVLGIYLIMGIITYVAYSMDKSKAIDDDYRTEENTLHIMSLLGGWLGALIAQQRFRHKTTKVPFQVIFKITVILNVGILITVFKLYLI